MKTGTLISIIIGTLALCGMVFAFLNQASPYVTVAQAKSSTSKRMHLPGEMDKSTLVNRPLQGVVEFDLIDETGQRIHVISKDRPANMGNATKVVAIGKVEGNSFHADELMLKCPTKYTSEQSATAKPKNEPY